MYSTYFWGLGKAKLHKQSPIELPLVFAIDDVATDMLVHLCASQSFVLIGRVECCDPDCVPWSLKPMTEKVYQPRR